MKLSDKFAVFLVLCLVAAALYGAWVWYPREQRVSELTLADHRPVEVLVDGYVSSAECQSCHPRNFASWHASYHRTMTRVASPQTVHGDFAAPPMTFDGRYYELQRRGDQYWTVMDDPDGELDPAEPMASRIERPIALVTGSHHLQLYWYPTGQSRVLGLLPVHYFKDDKKWLPTSATMLRPPDEFSSDTGRWNSRCIQCHTTHGRTRPEEDGADSQVAEFGISCEACHGPAAAHVTYRRTTPNGDASRSEDPIVNPALLAPKTASQICGLCHSYTLARTRESEQHEIEHGFHYRPGQQLTDSLILVKRDLPTRKHLQSIGIDPEVHFDERFWSDGMVRVAGREYNGMVGSPCHLRGEMSCMSCHAMHKPDDDPRSLDAWADHQLKHDRDSDHACLQCHTADQYAVPAHTHHAAGSQGSRCYNCHMPNTNYGLLRALRSHQIESPNVAVSVQTGRPNGCNLCHLDKPLGWTAQLLKDWYGQQPPKLSDDDQKYSAAAVWVLTGDAGQRAIVGWNMGWQPAIEASGTDWMPPLLLQLMQDSYDVVRHIGYRSLTLQPGFADLNFDFVGPLAERNKVIKETLSSWQAAARSPRETPEMVLLDASGGRSQKLYDRLLVRRNRRPVVLQE
ncbi:MAG: C cytochrome precursor [Planctomycetes bacterium]|nr:C cytochrome precursor [Planctomycetota bacterium]